MIHLIDNKPINIYQYLSLMLWAEAVLSRIKKQPDTIVETNHFMMDVRGGQVIKY